MAKENQSTKKKGNNSAFQRFQRLAQKIVRVPKDQARDKKPR